MQFARGIRHPTLGEQSANCVKCTNIVGGVVRAQFIVQGIVVMTIFALLAVGILFSVHQDTCLPNDGVDGHIFIFPAPLLSQHSNFNVSISVEKMLICGECIMRDAMIVLHGGLERP